uniref:Uncharacterized protein n=1 Tax=Avena sativa TaxID=4498 RepID=A0ACD5YKV4_AVESA
MISQSRNGKGMVSDWSACEKDWKAVWKVRAPGKMLIHLWRFSHDCLPSGVQLRKRQIADDGTCIFYGRTEGIEHSLLFCQFARVVWREVKMHIDLHLVRKRFSSTKQWLFDYLARSTDIQCTTLAVVFWHLWDARNEARNSDIKPNPSRTSGKILAYIDLIKQNLYRSCSQHRCESTPTLKWTPPPRGTVLVNCDAAISQAAGGVSAGVVLRDHSGTCLVACCQFYEGLLPPELAEAVALRRAVELARDEGKDRVIFASDCLSLVQRLNSPCFDRSDVGLVTNSIKFLVRGFASVSFCHVNRVLNEAAHILAKSCTHVNSSCVFYPVSECIRKTLCIDVI